METQWKWRTAIEPFRIKCVEPLGFTSADERRRALEEAGFNVGNIPAEKVLLDLLTDSGFSAMSARQWGALMEGDESYAGARSFYALEKAVRELTGYREVIPAHQGRAAERLLFSVLGGPGKVFLANAHFATTRANIEATGARAVDLPAPEAWEPAVPSPFKGDLDTQKLEAAIREHGPRNVPLVLMTVTNNVAAGHPVSMQNLRDTREICAHYRVPFLLDAARFAENAYLIKKRTAGYASRPAADVAREMFSYAQGCLMSAKKDLLCSTGGVLALNDADWARRVRETMIAGEGFPTYGGLAGRDLEAMARGASEAVDDDHLAYRLRTVESFSEALRKAGIPIVEPAGGHAVYIDVGRFLPRIPPEQFPGAALACELYLAAGIRAADSRSLAHRRDGDGRGEPGRPDLLRLAVPRRTYSRSQLELVVEVLADIDKRKGALRGLRLLGPDGGPGRLTAALAPL